MKEIKCPKCNTTFKIDENDYESIVKQIKNHEYEKQYMQKLEEPYKHNGIDRTDPNKGYTTENCVSCCSKCNYAKHEMTLSEYKEWLIKSYEHLISSSSTIPQGSTSQANGDGNDVHPIKDEDIV